MGTPCRRAAFRSAAAAPRPWRGRPWGLRAVGPLPRRPSTSEGAPERRRRPAPDTSSARGRAPPPSEDVDGVERAPQPDTSSARGRAPPRSRCVRRRRPRAPGLRRCVRPARRRSAPRPMPPGSRPPWRRLTSAATNPTIRVAAGDSDVSCSPTPGRANSTPSGSRRGGALVPAAKSRTRSGRSSRNGWHGAPSVRGRRAPPAVVVVWFAFSRCSTVRAATASALRRTACPPARGLRNLLTGRARRTSASIPRGPRP